MQQNENQESNKLTWSPVPARCKHMGFNGSAGHELGINIWNLIKSMVISKIRVNGTQ